MSQAQEQIQEAIEILNHISEDQSVPRNIRRAAVNSIKILNDKEMELPVRAINAIDILNDLSIDPNCPYHARTLLWQVITRLEISPDDEDEDDEDEDEDE